MNEQERRASENAVPREGDVYRHTRRGGSYIVIGHARLQTARSVGDDDALVIYKGEGGELWARPVQEFCDGRFELLTFDPEPS